MRIGDNEITGEGIIQSYLSGPDENKFRFKRQLKLQEFLIKAVRSRLSGS
jgi:hypothetical protein